MISRDELISKSVVLSTRLFTVEKHRYRSDSGTPLERDIVVHPGAAVILPFVNAHQIVWIRNYRHAVAEALLELPAGKIEPGESPLETAARELEEETGYRAARLEPLTEFYMSPGILTERMHVFCAYDLSWVGARLEGTEDITTEIADIEVVRSMLVLGELEDAKTIATLGMYFALQAMRPGGGS